MQSKWKNMSAERLRQPVSQCLKQVDGNISNTQGLYTNCYQF